MDASETAWGALLRTLKPQLEEQGFSSDGQRYFLRSDLGDYAVIELEQSIEGSARGPRPSAFVNLAIVPAPWLDWMRTRFPDNVSSWTQCPDLASGMWRERLPEPRTKWQAWRLPGDADASVKTAMTISAEVRRRGAPRLRTLLIRGNLLAEVEETWAYRAALLIDERPAELPLLVEQCDHPDRQVEFIAWLTRYAAGERATRPA